MPHFDPRDSLGFHCNLTVKAFLAAWNLKGTGVSRAQLMAIAQLVALGPLSQSELAGLLSITRATGVRLIDRMERDGWVIRQPDLKDGRIKLVSLTEKTVAVWKKISGTGKKVMNKAYRGVPPADIETVKRVLEQVRRNLKEN